MLADIEAEEHTTSLVAEQAATCPAVRQQMKNVKLWADTKQIAYTLWRLKIAAFFYDDVTGKPYCGITRKHARYEYDTILCNWHRHRHFEGIAFLDEQTRSPQFRFTRAEVEAGANPLLAFFVRSYESCTRPHAVIMAM